MHTHPPPHTLSASPNDEARAYALQTIRNLASQAGLRVFAQQLCTTFSATNPDDEDTHLYLSGYTECGNAVWVLLQITIFGQTYTYFSPAYADIIEAIEDVAAPHTSVYAIDMMAQ